MLLTLTFLIVGHLHFTQPTHVANLHYTQGWSQQLQQPQVTGVPLKPANLTIVKTWK